MSTQAETDTPSHPPYKGSVLFKDPFGGQLPATDYPKVNVSVPSRQPLIYMAFIHFVSVLLRHVPHLRRFRSFLGMALLPPHQ